MAIEGVNPHALAAFEDLSQCIGLDPNDLGGTATMTGEDFPRVSVHRLASASSVALAAVGVGVGALWRLRSGSGQDVESRASCPAITL